MPVITFLDDQLRAGKEAPWVQEKAEELYRKETGQTFPQDVQYSSVKSDEYELYCHVPYTYREDLHYVSKYKQWSYARDDGSSELLEFSKEGTMSSWSTGTGD